MKKFIILLIISLSSSCEIVDINYKTIAIKNYDQRYLENLYKNAKLRIDLSYVLHDETIFDISDYKDLSKGIIYINDKKDYNANLIYIINNIYSILKKGIKKYQNDKEIFESNIYCINIILDYYKTVEYNLDKYIEVNIDKINIYTEYKKLKYSFISLNIDNLITEQKLILSNKYLERADFFVKSKDYDQAYEDYFSAYKYNKDSNINLNNFLECFVSKNYYSHNEESYLRFIGFIKENFKKDDMRTYNTYDYLIKFYRFNHEYNKAISIFKDLKKLNIITDGINLADKDLAEFYTDLKFSNEAIIQYNVIIDSLNKNDIDNKKNIYSSIYKIYLDDKDYDKSIEYINKLLEITTDKDKKMDLLLDLADIYNITNDENNLLEVLKSSSLISEPYKIDRIIGDFYYNKKDYVKSTFYYNKSYAYYNISTKTLE